MNRKREKVIISLLKSPSFCLNIPRFSMLGGFCHVLVQDSGEYFSLFPGSNHVCIVEFGTMVRIMFPSIMGRVFLHDSVRDCVIKKYSLASVVAASGVSRHTMRREGKCVFLSSTESTVLIRRLVVFENSAKS